MESCVVFLAANNGYFPVCIVRKRLLSWESKDLYPRPIINQTLEMLSSS